MITYTWYRSGDLFAMRYVIPAGDAIPMHAHDATTLHNVVVLSGQVRFESSPTQVLNAGDVHDFDGSVPHRILALRDSIILNFFLNGIPPGYADLPPSEHSGVIP